MNNPTPQSLLAQLDSYLTLYLIKKAPVLPDKIKTIIVKFLPILILVVLALSLPAVLFALGLGALLSPFAYLRGINTGLSFSLINLFFLASLVLTILALPGLFARKIAGWNYLFYASIINAVHALFSFDLGSLLIGTLISWYILYQIKSYYK